MPWLVMLWIGGLLCRSLLELVVDVSEENRRVVGLDTGGWGLRTGDWGRLLDLCYGIRFDINSFIR